MRVLRGEQIIGYGDLNDTSNRIRMHVAVFGLVVIAWAIQDIQ